MKQALTRYHDRFDRFGWQPGMLRAGRSGLYVLPRWVDDTQMLGVHLVRRARWQCLTCGMRQPRPFSAHTSNRTHKMDCAGSWRLRDDLLQLFHCPKGE